jgi:hypothetical protein
MKRWLPLILLVTVLTLAFPQQPAGAQTYSFSIDWELVDVYWESNGTVRIEYQIAFRNDTFASPIDYVDIGLPTDDYLINAIEASVDGFPINDIAPSPYVDPGVALGLGSYAIQPGDSGVVRLSIGRVEGILRQADEPGYASGLFTPTWFDEDLVHGTLDLTVIFHLPPGVQPDEPRWFASPRGWPEEAPSTGLDSEGRVQYTWHNPAALGSEAYVFGASFPLDYVPEADVPKATLRERLGLSSETITAGLCCLGFGGFLALIITAAVLSSRRRKLAYLPPKMAIEGHGIKRGLTAVEAAILLETPLDKVLTMILFSTIKKGAAKVVTEEPLKVQAIEPAPEGLRDYEKAFLEASALPRKRAREKRLQETFIKLVKSVQAKMKGFSLRETKDYYRSIIRKAWKQVEEAKTPEVKSERYSEDIEWTMLDRDFEDRTRRVFRTGPVFLPTWWPSYRPSMAGAPGRASIPSSRTSAGPAGRVSLPSLPGADFAASIANSVQNAAASFVSNVTSFTGNVTKTTNPPPPPSRTGGSTFRSSGSGPSCACACACACAGCACACAGGGR